MSQQKGERRGIHTIADMKLRCHVCPDSGCWLPKVGTRANRSGGREPCVYVPALGRNTSIGAAITVLTTGKPPRPDRVSVATCENRHCANPKHRRITTRGMQAPSAPCQIERKQAITKARRAASAISDETVEAIRRSTGPLRKVAAEYGVSMTYVSKVRLGLLRAPLIAGASVFNWAGR